MNQTSSSVVADEPHISETVGVQIAGDVHRRAKIDAAAHGITLFRLLNDAVTQYVDARQPETKRLLRG